MSLIEKMTPAPRKVMTLFYMDDVSGSMSGSKIGTVNAAMEETGPLLREVAAANDDAEIKVAVLQFSSGCSWLTPAPVTLDNYVWNDLKAGGMTDFGCALAELDSKLSRTEFLKSQTGAFAPVILLLSDGGPTDAWEEALENLKKNNWFKFAIKIAIDIESGSDRRVLEAFTGNSEAILDAKDTATLKKMIRKVSVRASEFQSHSKDTEDDQTTPEQDAGDIVKAVVEEIHQEELAEQTTAGVDNPEWGKWK